MISHDDFLYALENTRVVRAPQRHLETFQTSVLNYFLITEHMDRANVSRVREGSIHAERPQILTPANFSRLLLEGFGEQAGKFAEMINRNGGQVALLRYGFRVSKSDVRFYEVHESVGEVTEKVRLEVEGRQDPLAAVLTGVDDGWEVCLLKFMLDMAMASGGDNLKDFKDRGLI
jgi:hypothetical protein